MSHVTSVINLICKGPYVFYAFSTMCYCFSEIHLVTRIVSEDVWQKESDRPVTRTNRTVGTHTHTQTKRYNSVYTPHQSSTTGNTRQGKPAQDQQRREGW